MEEDNCKCGCDHEKDEEISTEDMVNSNNFVLNALIDLLIEKNVISEKEFMTRLDEMAKEDEESDEKSE